MSNPFVYFWRHPRRTGFIIFNVIVLASLLAWAVFTNNMAKEGLGGIPNVMLGYTGMTLLTVAWIVGWLAWGTMVARRHSHHGPDVSTAGSIPPSVPTAPPSGPATADDGTG